MKITRVTTRYIDTNPYAGLCEEDAPYTPRWICTIVCEWGFKHTGEGKTEKEAITAAAQNMLDVAENIVRKAISDYNNEQGAYFIDC